MRPPPTARVEEASVREAITFTGGSALRCSLNAALLRQDAVAVIVSDPAGATVMHAELV